MVEKLILKNCTVFDGVHADLQQDRDIVIEAGSIIEIGNGLATSSTAAKVVDCSNDYVIPGLWDCHAHLAHLVPEGESIARNTLARFLEHGVTSVRDVGGPLLDLQKMATRINTGEYVGPDMYYAGPMLEKGPLTWAQFNETMPGFTVAVDDAAQAEQIVRQIKQRGGALVKVFNKFDRDVLECLLEQARACFLPVTLDPGAPFFHDVPMDLGLALGIRCFEHAKSPWPCVFKNEFQGEYDRLLSSGHDPAARMSFVERVFPLGTDSIDLEKLDCLLETCREAGAFICPTLNIMLDNSFPAEREMTEEEHRARQRALAIIAKVCIFFIKAMAKKGIKLLVGQDGATPENTWAEMFTLEAQGLAPLEIIRGASLYPAQWLGCADRVGSIQPGQKADVLILRENPLTDLKNIRSIHTVIKNGRITKEPSGIQGR
ncbi:amidohydrolase family protein [bacterium]|nr:amidohydrolase family protein [bacterium]